MSRKTYAAILKHAWDMTEVTMPKKILNVYLNMLILCLSVLMFNCCCLHVDIYMCMLLYMYMCMMYLLPSFPTAVFSR